MSRHTAPSCGISNESGSACHVNSVLQALSHVPELVKAVLSKRADRARQTVLASVRSAMIAVWANAPTGRTQHVSGEVLRSIAARMSGLGAGDATTEQCDAHEVYGEIADALASGEARPGGQAAPAGQADGGGGGMRALLVGRMDQLVRCSHCGATNASTEDFLSIALGARAAAGPYDLSDLLVSEFEPEGVEGYRCEAARCGRRSGGQQGGGHATRMCRLRSLPGVLALCLKRNQPVLKPATIGPSTLLHLSAVGSPAAAEAARGRVRYSLAAVVCLSNRHYVAYVRRPISGEWHLHDDDRTTTTGTTGPCPAPGGYLVIYSKETAFKSGA